MAKCAVSGNIKDLFGLRHAEKAARVRRVFTSGTVRFRLCRQPRASAKPIVTANQGQAAVTQYDFDVQLDGSFTGVVEANDGLEPEKTFYEVSFMVPTFQHAPRFYRVTGTRFNLNAETPWHPVSADVWVND